MEDKLVQTSDTSRTFSKLQTPDGKHFCDRNKCSGTVISMCLFYFIMNKFYLFSKILCRVHYKSKKLIVNFATH